MKTVPILQYNATIRLHDLPGKGIPVLFIHGLGCASSSDYPAVVRDARLRERHVILLDLLGSGFSDKPTGFSYSILGHAAVVVEVIKQLGLEKFHLFGHSMGGSVAIVTASNPKPMLASLILSEPNLDAGGGNFSRKIATYTEKDYCERGYQKDIEQALASGNNVWAGSLAVSAAFAIHREASSLVAGFSPSWRETLLHLNVPRTLLFGENSLPDDDYDTLPKQGMNVDCISSAGHSVAWENPSGLASAIADSLARTETSKL